MKKFLSLVLALVMTMSLVTISAGAADFTDDSDIEYQEAVDVISALGIVDGYSDDSFRPDGSLTRGAAAKIICNLILGPTTASALSASTAPFKDVPTTNTFAGYITYCAQQGIISGYGDGTFRPTGSLTGNAFMKMLLGALGYDSSIEGYTGSNWQVNVTKQAIGIGLDDGNDDFVGSRTVTRQEAALYAFNMLNSTMVEYEQKSTIVVGGVEINTTSARHDVANSATNETIDEDDKMQFAERYFTNLTKRDGTDDFARPSNVWRLRSTVIGTYPKEPDATYTAKVKAGDIYSDLNLGETIPARDVTVYDNGVEKDEWALDISRRSDAKVANSANGVLTEVYYDQDKDTIDIIRIDTYVGTVVKTVAATSDRDTYVVINPETVNPGIGNQEFETNQKFEDDAYVLYTYSKDAKEVESVALAEEVNGVVTRAENVDENDTDKTALTIDGNRYTASVNVSGTENLSNISVDEEYTVYLDAYGYLIYVERIDEIGDYALLYQVSSGNWDTSNRAYLVFADGTSARVNTTKNYADAENLNYDANGDDKVNSTDDTYWDSSSWNTYKPVIVTYRVNDNGEYTLRAVNGYQGFTRSPSVAGIDAAVNETDFSLINDKAGITGLPGGTVTANSATTFVVRDPASRSAMATDEDWTAYTGVKSAPSIETVNRDATAGIQPNEMVDVYYYCKNGSMATIMFIVPDVDVVIEDGNNKNIYLSAGSVSNLIHDRDGSYYEYDAVVDGAIETVRVASDVFVDNTKQSEQAAKRLGDQIYARYSTNSDGIITRLYSGTTYNAITGMGLLNDLIGVDKVSREYTVILNTGKDAAGTALDPLKRGVFTITVDEDANIFYVDEDGNITTSSYNGIAIDNNDVAWASMDDYMVQTLVIREVKGDEVLAPSSDVSISNLVVKGVTATKGTTVGNTTNYTVSLTAAQLANASTADMVATGVADGATVAYAYSTDNGANWTPSALDQTFQAENYGGSPWLTGTLMLKATVTAEDRVTTHDYIVTVRYAQPIELKITASGAAAYVSVNGGTTVPIAAGSTVSFGQFLSTDRVTIAVTQGQAGYSVDSVSAGGTAAVWGGANDVFTVDSFTADTTVTVTLTAN